MAIRTVEMEKLKWQSSNLYEITAALSRRAREVNENYRQELEEKLSPFKIRSRNPTNEAEAEKVFPEQVGISIKFERLPKPTQISIDEYLTQSYSYDYPAITKKTK